MKKLIFAIVLFSGMNLFAQDSLNMILHTKNGPVVYSVDDIDSITFKSKESIKTVNDFEGNVYEVVAINGDYWMASNLKTTKYNDGSSIVIAPDTATWIEAKPRMAYFNNDVANSDIYGALYNGYSVETGKLCPVDWHVATSTEYEALFTSVSSNSTARISLMADYGWASVEGHLNELGFSAVGGGGRRPSTTFFNFEFSSFYWCGNYPARAVIHNTGVDSQGSVGTSTYPYGYSVRCVKD